jgi:uncharacterized protein (DUF697 family)
MESAEVTTVTEVVPGPSPREKEALATANHYMAWSAAGGLLPLPGVDVAAILAIQLKMLADIAHIYDVPFRREIVKEGVSGLLGSFLPVTVAQASGSAIKMIPIIGQIASVVWQPALAAAATWAMAKVFIQHFESGGTFLDFKPEAVKEYFREQYEAARAGIRGRGASTHAHPES